MKKDLRLKFKEVRKNKLPKVESIIINKVIEFLEIEINSKNKFIGIYWPLKGEVDLRVLKSKNIGIPLALPASDEFGNLSYHPWGINPLGKDFHGIPSPINERVLNPSEIFLLLVPAIAIDQNGYRLGYGGGFFDRLRSNYLWREIQALAILPNACISNTSLPKDKWDIPFDGWINEKGVFRLLKK